MAARIEDYAIVGDTQSVALVGRDGSIDWLCLPRIDSGALFAALLGDPSNGRWSIAPAEAEGPRRVTRRYLPGTLVLETTFEVEGGAVQLIDFMPIRTALPDIVRIVRGLSGRVRLAVELNVRFDYGSIAPWVRELDGRWHAIAGPDAVTVDAPCMLPLAPDARATFEVAAGQECAFVMVWHPSHVAPPPAIDAREALENTTAWWREWSGRNTQRGPWREAVERSLLVLKALTFAPTGGVIAAATTSLPEWIGGVRNWDYRYGWLRDATFTLCALMGAGYMDEARAWRDWLARAVAGDPSSLQIMYGVAGERRLTEWEVPWLGGYEASRPVRVGNLASTQFQLDVYGEVADALYQAESHGLAHDPETTKLASALLEFLEGHWSEPDDGLWEVRGGRRHFTHSKVMAWVAADRAARAADRFHDGTDADRWRRLAATIHADVCRRGYDADRGAFVQSYGSKALDASLLMLPLVGFLPADDPRVTGTIAAIEKELVVDGFVRRYKPEEAQDGLPGPEGAFLMCTFWLADCLALQGRHDAARALFERLLALRNDVGLLSEQWDFRHGRLLGNFPQAFSHVSLINTASRLEHRRSPAEIRARP